MTKEEKEAVLHCLKAMIDEELCEECPLYGTTGTDHCEKDCVRLAIEELEKKLCDDDAISRYQKIKQMLYELKEMPLAPCLMKGHTCAVHEILNEVIEPSASSSQKPVDPAYEKTLNKWIGAEVLDRIRNEMHATAEKHEDGVYYLRDEWVDEIIDKYAEGSDS